MCLARKIPLGLWEPKREEEVLQKDCTECSNVPKDREQTQSWQREQCKGRHGGLERFGHLSCLDACFQNMVPTGNTSITWEFGWKCSVLYSASTQ